MILPTITAISYDVILSVPAELRSGSVALGTTRWQTIRHVLPAGMAGIATAVVLGMMRAAGEALAVQMVIGNTPVMPTALTKPVTTLTSQITLDMGNTVQGEPWNQALWTMGLVLLLMSFAFVVLVRVALASEVDGMRRALAADRIATGVLWAIGVFVVLVLGAIILHFVLSSIGTISLSFLFGPPSDTSVGGIGPLLWNSLYMLVLTMLFTLPLGILGGIYMAEYAGPGRLPNLIRTSQELISSVPSIVVGLFGLALFVNATGWGFTALAGALALTVFNLPLMMRLTEQALRAVPDVERDGSLALGATRWQAIRHVVLPLAIPGMVTGIILAAGRIFGEAAALLFTAGISSPTAYNFTNFNLAIRSRRVAHGTRRRRSPCTSGSSTPRASGRTGAMWPNASAAVLVVMVLLFNLGSRALGRVLQRRVTGASLIPWPSSTEDPMLRCPPDAQQAAPAAMPTPRRHPVARRRRRRLPPPSRTSRSRCAT